MASTRRKSAAIALAIIGVAGLSLASAATLNLTSSPLAAGTVVVGACDDAAVVGYTTALGAGGEYFVTAINLSSLSATCDAHAYAIQPLQGAAGAKTVLGGELTGTDLEVAVGETATVILGTPVSASLITGVSIVIR